MKKPIILALAAALTLGACSYDNFHNRLVEFNSTVKRVAPLIGKDLIMIGNIIVQAQCSPAIKVVDGATINTLKIVAPNSTAAAKVQDFLLAKQEVADQLCPIYDAIQAAHAIDVKAGSVPTGTVSQVIPTS
jgi:hypothetical protein